MMKPIEQLVSGVYFIHAPNQSKIKIGRSTDIKKRYKQLRTGFMDDGTLLICIPTKDEVKLENVLHEKFDHLRANGEWFYMTKEIDDFIQNCKFEYPNVIIYQDLNEIQSKLSYNSLEMFNLMNTLKSIVEKYSIPIISGAIGIIIAYYNYKFDVPSRAGKLGTVVNYLLFLALPALTALLWSQIIKYQSTRTFKLYAIFLVIILASGVVSLFFEINHTFLIWIQTLLVSIYFPAIQQLLMLILAKQADEEIRRNVKEQLPKTIISVNDLIEVIKQREFVTNRIKQSAKIIKLTGQISHIVAFLFINIYFLLISDSEWIPRFLIIKLTDITIALWLLTHFIESKARFSKFIWLGRFKKWIIPTSVLIIYWTLMILKLIHLSFVFGGIVMASMIPRLLIILFTVQRIKKDKFKRDEIDRMLQELK